MVNGMPMKIGDRPHLFMYWATWGRNGNIAIWVIAVMNLPFISIKCGLSTIIICWRVGTRKKDVASVGQVNS